MKKVLKDIWELSGAFAAVFLIVVIILALAAIAGAFVVKVFEWTYNLLP